MTTTSDPLPSAAPTGSPYVKLAFDPPPARVITPPCPVETTTPPPPRPSLPQPAPCVPPASAPAVPPPLPTLAPAPPPPTPSPPPAPVPAVRVAPVPAPTPVYSSAPAAPAPPVLASTAPVSVATVAAPASRPPDRPVSVTKTGSTDARRWLAIGGAVLAVLLIIGLLAADLPVCSLLAKTKNDLTAERAAVAAVTADLEQTQKDLTVRTSERDTRSRARKRNSPISSPAFRTPWTAHRTASMSKRAKSRH